MTRVVAIFDVGNGPEAMVFGSQAEVYAFTANRPEFDDAIQSLVPIASRRDLVRRKVI